MDARFQYVILVMSDMNIDLTCDTVRVECNRVFKGGVELPDGARDAVKCCITATRLHPCAHTATFIVTLG